jgi:hypothetical protein
MLLLGVVSALVVGASTVSAEPGPFTINSFSANLQPGESLLVTGSGCPPTSPLASGQVLQLRLTPPTGGNAWGVSLDNGKPLLASTQVGVAGETDVVVTAKEDGSFSATIVIPANAPVASGYTVRGVCLTLLVPGAGPGGFTQESYDASFTQAGALEVVAAPIPIVTPPAFTG